MLRQIKKSIAFLARNAGRFRCRTNVVVLVLDEEGDVGGGLDVGSLALRPVPDVQHRVALLGDESLRLVGVHEAHLCADGGGGGRGGARTSPPPTRGQAHDSRRPAALLPDPHGYPRTSDENMQANPPAFRIISH